MNNTKKIILNFERKEIIFFIIFLVLAKRKKYFVEKISYSQK